MLTKILNTTEEHNTGLNNSKPCRLTLSYYSGAQRSFIRLYCQRFRKQSRNLPVFVKKWTN